MTSTKRIDTTFRASGSTIMKSNDYWPTQRRDEMPHRPQLATASQFSTSGSAAAAFAARPPARPPARKQRRASQRPRAYETVSQRERSKAEKRKRCECESDDQLHSHRSASHKTLIIAGRPHMKSSSEAKPSLSILNIRDKCARATKMNATWLGSAPCQPFLREGNRSRR